MDRIIVYGVEKEKGKRRGGREKGRKEEEFVDGMKGECFFVGYAVYSCQS
jgi:hypothetical protein